VYETIGYVMCTNKRGTKIKVKHILFRTYVIYLVYIKTVPEIVHFIIFVFFALSVPHV